MEGFAETVDLENVAKLENMITVSRQIPTTEFIDMSIDYARDKKKTVKSEMDSVMSLIREVELSEKAAEEAKQQSKVYSSDMLVQVNDLKRAAQRAKEKNDMRASEVNADKAALASAMKDTQLRVLDVLNKGNGYLLDLDEMRKSLNKRLDSARMIKEAADKLKLETEASLAYQKSQLEMAEKEAKRLEQESMENYKLQDFLLDRGYAVDLLQEEIHGIRLNVDLLKEELEDHMETEQPLMPIIQGPLLRYGCECGKCTDVLECVEGTGEATRNSMIRSNRILKRLETNEKYKTMKKWIEGEIAEAMTEYEQDKHYSADDFVRDIVDDIYGYWT